MDAMRHWGALNKVLTTFTETELKSMLDFECMTKRRADFIKRIHARYSKLRNKRELQELLNEQ